MLHRTSPVLTFVASAALLGAVSCAGSVTREEQAGAWDSPQGEVTSLPPNGSSPSSGAAAGSDDWNGWWVRFPDVIPTGVAAHGEDLMLAGQPVEPPLELGGTHIGSEGFVARISSDGEVLWVQPGAQLVAVDASGNAHVTSGPKIVTFNAGGALLREHTFGDGVDVHGLAATADGGLLLGLEVFSTPLHLPDGSIADLPQPPPLAVLVRLNGAMETIWWREAHALYEDSGGAAPWPGFVGVGEDGAGQVVAVTGGVSHTSWGSVTTDSPTDTGKVAAGFSGDGDLLWATEVTGIGDSGRAISSREIGVLLSGGAVGPLVVGSNSVDYGDPGTAAWSPEPQGVALRLDDTGTLDSAVALGDGAHVGAPGPGRMFAASRPHAGVLELVWCSTGASPCDRYRLEETETAFNAVAVTESGKAAYLAGEYRATPGGAQTERMQLSVMRLEH